MIRVVLAEDHQVVRQGLRALLEAEADLAVIGEADDGLQVVERVRDLAPDVLVLDWMLPGLQGLEVTRQILKEAPTTEILILSMHADESYVIQALRAGASGYVLKDAGASELVKAIHECVAGRRYLSETLPAAAIEEAVRRRQTGQLDPYHSLTNREREILQMVAEGDTNQEIADRLSISRRTVETHRLNLMRKLDLQNQADVTRYAIKRGLIDVG